MMIKYAEPLNWIFYDIHAVIGPLTDAKAAVMALTGVPYRRSWADKLQDIQLKQEVAGTSRIEGAEFTDDEFKEALAEETDENLLTRSQRQARAAVNTYRWLTNLPSDRPLSTDIILEIHRRIVTGCDDDHCEPGALRRSGHNVVFGTPPHRGVEGGADCSSAFARLEKAITTEFREHDILIQALAIHYHLGAMHPFLDGNGRTARASEALMLQKSGLKDALFISLSNYYYDEKQEYLKKLASVRANNHDLTEFLVFGLKGIALQCRRLLAEINKNISKTLFRDMAHELFSTLQSPKKRVLAKRQVALLNFLLERSPMDVNVLYREMQHHYDTLQDAFSGFVRDVLALSNLNAISLKRTKVSGQVMVEVKLDWPTEITETKFFQEMQKMPKAKTFDFMNRISD